jgi:hypothetical protein
MMMLFACMVAGALSAAPANEPSPITVNCLEGRGYATFTNRLHPGNRIGYRFHEHTPITNGVPPDTLPGEQTEREASARAEKEFSERPGVQIHDLTIDATAGWTEQRWIYYLAPVEDGIELLWVMEAFDSGLNPFYGVQQCFRMSGLSNEAWRREIAETPAFSEFDMWNLTEKEASVKTSLTYVCRKGEWTPLPAEKSTVGARTPLGLDVDSKITNGNLVSMPEVGPYHARMLDPVDNGLIARTDREHTWVCGIYWQRTSHVTDHHPADCLHAIVNIGGIPPHAKHVLRGRIYWFRGTLQDLADRWRRDFPTE